jgi:hypothetical protein
MSYGRSQSSRGHNYYTRSSSSASDSVSRVSDSRRRSNSMSESRSMSNSMSESRSMSNERSRSNDSFSRSNNRRYNRSN